MRARFLLPLLLSATLFAAQPAYGPGTTLDTLVVGATTYRQVQIRSVNPRTLIITHTGGMASIRLRDLSPEWQQRFNYDPAVEAADASPQPPPVARPSSRRPATFEERPIAALLRQFGEPAALQPRVDLRPRFFELELGVKNQGRRPSCAVFAVVSALEFQHAQLTGTPQKFSEEYLSWATLRTIHRVPPLASEPANDDAAAEDADAGFTLREVLAALRGYGIPPQSSMPNTVGLALDAIAPPSPEIVEAARRHQRVFVHEIPGRDNATRINNLVHALNAGMPIAIGLGWPHFRLLRTGYLSGQTPMPGSGHAVTLVGYLAADSGRIEDTVFVFKNSWGVAWGQGGYGTVTYGYLQQHLDDAVLLEVQPGA